MKTLEKRSAPEAGKVPDGEPEGHGIWTGTVSFSLVAIPVKLVSALGTGQGFHLLHSRDHSPLRRRMLCSGDGKIVPAGEIVRGYELEPGRYLPITGEELESLSPERSRSIEISEFIALAEVDPIYFERPYFLVPMKGGERSYRLLAEALRRSGKAGLARFVLNEREYPVLVRSRDGALALDTLHYGAELLPEGRPAPKTKGEGNAEKDAIKKRIRAMTTAFVPEKYSDERRRKLAELLRKKAGGKAQVSAPETGEEPAEEVADLMAALEESMRRMKKSR